MKISMCMRQQLQYFFVLSQVKFPSPRLLVILLYSIIRNYCLYIFWSSNIIFLFCLFYLLSPHYLPALLQHVCEEDIEAY
jgi:hypothetical protein